MAECVIQLIGERQIVSAASLQVKPPNDILNSICLSRASPPSTPMGWQKQSRFISFPLRCRSSLQTTEVAAGDPGHGW